MLVVIDLAMMLLFVMILFFVYLSLTSSQKNNKKAIVLILVSYALIIAFRSIGDDTFNYIKVYNTTFYSAENFTLSVKMEEVWYYIISMLKMFGFNHNLFFFICALTPALLSLYLYNKTETIDNKDNILFIIVFIIVTYFHVTNIVRSYSMLIFFPLSLYYLTTNKMISYFICCVIAYLLHSSGLIILPVSFIAYSIVYFKERKLTIFVITSIIVVVLSSYGLYLMSLISDTIDHLIKFLTYYDKSWEYTHLGDPKRITAVKLMAIIHLIYSYLILFICRKSCDSKFLKMCYVSITIIILLSSILFIMNSYILATRILVFSIICSIYPLVNFIKKSTLIFKYLISIWFYVYYFSIILYSTKLYDVFL